MLRYFIIFLFFLELVSADFLKGRVIVLGDRYGKENIPIKVLFTDIRDTTIKNGNFKLNLGNEYQPGEIVTLTIDDYNWNIHNPADGRFVLPKSFYIEIEVVENMNHKNRQNKKVKHCVQISSFKSKLNANKLRDEFNFNWKDKYHAYTEIIDNAYKVLISVTPYSITNIKKLHQDIKKSRYRKSKPFIRKNCR